MNSLIHEGTIDASEDHYQITGIDRATRKVLVIFAHKGHGLHHSVFVEDIEDGDSILRVVQEHYEQYKSDIAKAHAQQEPLPNDVAALIGQRYATQDQQYAVR